MSRSVNTVLAALASLVVSSCALDISTADQTLSRVGTEPPLDERCFRVLGEYTHPDVFPPTISDPLSNELLPDRAIEQALAHPEDERAGLLAQYAVAIINLERGASASDAELDLIQTAELAIARSDDSEWGLEIMYALEDFNGARAIEVPCSKGVIDVVAFR